MTNLHFLLITHEFPPFKGGIANYSSGVAKALVRKGCSVLVVTIAGSTVSHHGNEIKEDGPEIAQIPAYEGPKWWRLVRLVLAYRGILRSRSSYSIHCLDTESWRILNLLNYLGDFPYSLTVHGSDVLSTSRSIRARLLGADRLFKGVTRVVAVSEFTRNLFLDKFSQCYAAPVGIAHPAPSEDILELSRKARTETRPGNPVLRILTVARIDPRKGHMSGFSALQQLASESTPAFEWIIVGEALDKEYFSVLRKSFAEASFPIKFAGSLSTEELADEYRKADLFLLAGEVHPERVEGFGMVYLEAGLFGLPSVGTLVGGTSEAVIDGVTGLMSRPGDMPGLIENLRILVTDADLRSKLGIAARHHASSFSWDRTIESTFPDSIQESL